MIHSLSAAVGVIPGVFAATSLALNLAGVGLAMPLWAVGAGFVSSGVALGSLWYVSARHVRSIVALKGGCHVRVTTASALLVLPATKTTVPVPFFRHKHTKSNSTVVTTIAPPGTPKDSVRAVFLPLDNLAMVPDPEALNQLLNGVAPLPTPGPLLDPAVAFWKAEQTGDGREYWWNEVTRQSQWDKPEALKSTG